MMEAPCTSKEEVAKDIKEIFSHIKSSPRNHEVIAKSCKRLREKSEAGYRGLVRLLNKYGYLSVLSDVDNSLLPDENSSTSGFKSARTLSTSSAPATLHPSEASTVSPNERSNLERVRFSHL